MGMPPRAAPFGEKLAYYRSQHESAGCRVTHLFGVPAIVVSLPLFSRSWKGAAGLFGVGWSLQLVGHRYFERNRPSFLGDPTYLIMGVVFVALEWLRVFRTGKLV